MSYTLNANAYLEPGNRPAFKNKLELHQYHLVDSSPLPILTSLSAMMIALGITFYWHPSDIKVIKSADDFILWQGLVTFSFVLLWWFISIVLESKDHHTPVVQKGLRLGVVLFIVSEVFFFFAFFWAFFHFSLSPNIFIGYTWPPKGTQAIDVWGLPLNNTLLLVTSGYTTNLAHKMISNAFLIDIYKFFAKYLFITIILGITFLLCQGIEYKYGIHFSWKENVFGSIFFATTGFHGFHVTIGTLFLWFCLTRSVITKYIVVNRNSFSFYVSYQIYIILYNLYIYLIKANIAINRYLPASLAEPALLNEDDISFDDAVDVETYAIIVSQIQSRLERYAFTPGQHIGFEAAAWYWHFVDVVWLFLYLTVYIWGCKHAIGAGILGFTFAI